MRSEYTVVRDWDAEVAQSSQVPDPKCARVSTGLVINTRRLGDEFEIEGKISRIVDASRKSLTMSAPLFTSEIRNVSAVRAGNSARAAKNDSPAMGLPGDTVNVEHPQVVATQFRFSKRLEGSKPAFYRTSANALLGQGRDVLIVVSRVQ